MMMALNTALIAQPLQDGAATAASMGSGASIGPMTWIGILVVMALIPFLLTMVTSFAKLVIVGGIIRQAMGTPQIPPTSVITGLALILSLHIMSPVMIQAFESFQTEEQKLPVPTTDEERSELAYDRIRLVLDSASEPMTTFLTAHAAPDNVELFRSLRTRLMGEQQQQLREPSIDAALELVTVLAPAFILTELTEAFQIGFLIFVPFLVIDLVVSNLLLAMGMHMLSPVTVSLPLKLLLFVLIDGWTLILQGIVMGYVI
ncbi:MAG: type III secretion protein R [Planctomycetota bacterium]|jgi:type III secretion protein R